MGDIRCKICRHKVKFYQKVSYIKIINFKETKHEDKVYFCKKCNQLIGDNLVYESK